MLKKKTISIVLFFFLCIASTSNDVLGQAYSDDLFDYDEFSINLSIEQLGFFEIDAIFYEDMLYLPLIELFNKLGIYVWHSAQIDTVQGFLLNEDNSYELNTITGQLVFRDKGVFLDRGQMILTYGDVFLPLSILEKTFGFSLRFNFRSLTVHLSSHIELPVIKQLRIERMRKNMQALTGEITADTTIYRERKLLGGAVVDWNLQINQAQAALNSQQLRTALGMELLGGELIMRTQFRRDSMIRMGNNYVNWRYVNDDNRIVKQFELGGIHAPLISQTTSGFLGLRITNTPTAFNRAFGVHVIQKKTSPGWEVELYVNNNLIDFTTADANGDFSFEIPLVFGSSDITLRYYGPWGEEFEEEIPISIPFTFTPHKQLEYQVLAGVTDDASGHLFTHSKISYGLNRRISLSAGHEFFEANQTDRNIGFASVNMVAGRNLLVNYTYVNNVMHNVSLFMRSRGNFVLDGRYRQYVPEQTIISSTNTAETELALNYPLFNRGLKISLRTAARIYFNNAGDHFFNETSVSFFYRRMNLGITSISSIGQTKHTYVGLNSALHMRNNWSIYLHSLFSATQLQAHNARIQLQKRFSNRFYTGLSYAHNFAAKDYLLSLSLHLDMSFIRTSSVTNTNRSELSSTQNLAGSLNFTGTPAPVFASNRNSVGRGGLDVLVFLDINHNGVWDPGEPLVKNASVSINRGKRVMNDNDSIHRFISLEPYAQHLVEVANAGFPYISWMIEHSTLAVYPSPNQIKKLYVPVKPMGEVEVQVLVQKDHGALPANRMRVNIHDESNKLVNRGLTDRAGYYFYLGLAPGKYTIGLDEEQLKNLGLIHTDGDVEFEIAYSLEGDFVDGIIITLDKQDL